MRDVPSPDPDAIAAGFIRYTERLRWDEDTGTYPNPETAVDEAAHEAFYDALRHGPTEWAWTLTRAMLRQAPDAELDVYAAGALEDLVRRWPAELVDAIEAEAARDERFQWALGCIWIPANVFPVDVEARLVRASGGIIKPFV